MSNSDKNSKQALIRNRYKNTCYLLAIFMSYCATSAAQEWQLMKDDDGIQIYTRIVEGYSYKAVRSDIVLSDTRLSSVVAVIRDSKECPQWSVVCKSANIIESVSEQENYVHTLSDLPWPARDRDVVSHVIWKQDPDTLIVTMTGEATTDKLPVSQGIVRLTEANIHWQLQSLAGGSTSVEFTAHINPASIFPNWITNMLLVDSPFQTLQGLRQQVKLKRYAEAELAYIEEPVQFLSQ